MLIPWNNGYKLFIRYFIIMLFYFAKLGTPNMGAQFIWICHRNILIGRTFLKCKGPTFWKIQIHIAKTVRDFTFTTKFWSPYKPRLFSLTLVALITLPQFKNFMWQNKKYMFEKDTFKRQNTNTLLFIKALNFVEKWFYIQKWHV